MKTNDYLIPMLSSGQIAAFYSNFTASGDLCWEWTGKRDDDGYGVFGVAVPGVGYKQLRAARTHYILERGPIGDLVPDHLCLNKPCVNLAHLEAVTVEENSRRANTGRTIEICQAGLHEMTGDNIVIEDRDGLLCRRCRACRNISSNARYHERVGDWDDRIKNGWIMCGKGIHPMTGANLLFESSGVRRCRACRTEYNRARNAANRAYRAREAALRTAPLEES